MGKQYGVYAYAGNEGGVKVTRASSSMLTNTLDSTSDWDGTKSLSDIFTFASAEASTASGRSAAETSAVPTEKKPEQPRQQDEK